MGRGVGRVCGIDMVSTSVGWMGGSERVGAAGLGELPAGSPTTDDHTTRIRRD